MSLPLSDEGRRKRSGWLKRFRRLRRLRLKSLQLTELKRKTDMRRDDLPAFFGERKAVWTLTFITEKPVKANP